MRFNISWEDVALISTWVLAFMISLGNRTVAEQQPVMAPMRKGFKMFGGELLSLVVGSSGKARLSPSLIPKAMQFSKTIPPAVGTAPFHKAEMPSWLIIFMVDDMTPLNSSGLVCILTLTVSNGCPCHKLQRDKGSKW